MKQQTAIIATQNPGKIREFKQLLGDRFTVYSANDIGQVNWVESGSTFSENSQIKALAINKRLPQNFKEALIIADDSGLCVDALDGAPGVMSARYAGEDAENTQNIELLLKNLQGVPQKDRTAHFVCQLTVMLGGRVVGSFEGNVEGHIAEKVMGSGGFGYDPIFVPKGFHATYSELPADIKNKTSHRSAALSKFSTWLESFHHPTSSETNS